MARSDAATLLATTGLPVVYDSWPDGSTPTFPCIRYVQDASNDFYADDAHYCKVDAWSAFLVSESKDDTSEAAIESAFDEAGVAYARLGEYDAEAERLHHVEYAFQLLRESPESAATAQQGQAQQEEQPTE